MRRRRSELGQHQSNQRTLQGDQGRRTQGPHWAGGGGGGAAEVCTLIAREQGGMGKGTWPTFTSLKDIPGRSCKAGYGKVTAGPEVICSVGGAEVTRLKGGRKR